MASRDDDELMDTKMEVDRALTNKNVKGRGMDNSIDDVEGGEYDSMDAEGTEGEPAKSIEGWIVLVTGIHDEAEENDLLDKLADYGSVQNFQLPLDRQTGFAKGYALAEYEKKEEAQSAITGLNNTDFMEKTIQANWAFVGKPKHA